jgi:hypothetical protein
LAVDVLKLSGTVSIETKQAEAGLKRVEQAADRARDGLGRFSKAGSAGVGIGGGAGDIGKMLNSLSGASSIRGLMAINAESLRARTTFDKLSEAAKTSLDKIRGSLTLTGNSLKVVRETVESVSSEIIESFGVDGDVANLLANNLNKVKLSSIAVGGAVVGLVVGVGALTVAMASAGAEIRNTSQLTGLSTDQVQRYEAAASAAGQKTDVFTDAIAKLRDRAKEALKGNVEIANSFQALGVSADTSTRTAGPAFEKLLDVLETVPDAQTRITIAQRVLGDVNDATLSGILALTDANGQLRDRVNDLSVAIDRQSVDSLATMNREWDALTTKTGIFAKQAGLQVVKTLGDLVYVMNGVAPALSHFSSEQDKAASKTNTTTGAINNQTSAVAALTQELASVRIDRINSSVDAQIQQIAVSAKTAKAAVDFFRQGIAIGDQFSKDVKEQDRIKANFEAIEKFRNPTKSRGSGVAKQLTELQQLQKQLSEARKDLIGFQQVGSKEFGLRIELEDSRALKSQLEEILKLRRSLGQVVAAPFPASAAGAESEIGRLKALQDAQERLAKTDFLAPLRVSAEQFSTQIANTIDTLDDLIDEALPRATDATTAQALEQNKLFQELLRTNPVLAEYYRQQAAAADATIRNTAATEAFRNLQSQLTEQLQGLQSLSVEQETAIKLQTDAYKDLNDEQRKQILDTARQIDAQSLYKDQLDQSQEEMEKFRDTTKGLFETLFNDGPKQFFDQLLSSLKRTLANMAAEITTSALFGGGRGGSAAVGGIAGGGHSGGLGGFLQGIFSGDQSGGDSFLTGGVAGGNPAAKILSGGGNGGSGILSGMLGGGRKSGGVGGLLGKIPGIGGLLNGTSAAASRARLENLPLMMGGGGDPTFAGQMAIPLKGAAGGGLAAGLGATGLLAGGGLLGSMLGGKSQFGRLLGGVGGTLLGGFAAGSGLFGGAMAGALPALFSNPITAVIGGALIGGALLSRLFGGGVEKSLKKLTQGEYGIKIDDSTAKALRSIGESKFGKQFKGKQIETIRLAESRDLLAEFAAATGQRGNSKLFTTAEFSDQYSSANLMKRAMGGPVSAGMPYLVGERRPEVFVPSQSGRIVPSVEQYAGGGGDLALVVTDLVGVVGGLASTVNRLRTFSPDQVIGMARPEAVSRQIEKSYRQRGQSSINVRNLNSKR